MQLCMCSGCIRALTNRFITIMGSSSISSSSSFTCSLRPGSLLSWPFLIPSTFLSVFDDDEDDDDDDDEDDDDG